MVYFLLLNSILSGEVLKVCKLLKITCNFSDEGRFALLRSVAIEREENFAYLQNLKYLIKRYLLFVSF